MACKFRSHFLIVVLLMLAGKAQGAAAGGAGGGEPKSTAQVFNELLTAEKRKNNAATTDFEKKAQIFDAIYTVMGWTPKTERFNTCREGFREIFPEHPTDSSLNFSIWRNYNHTRFHLEIPWGVIKLAEYESPDIITSESFRIFNEVKDRGACLRLGLPPYADKLIMPTSEGNREYETNYDETDENLSDDLKIHRGRDTLMIPNAGIVRYEIAKVNGKSIPRGIVPSLSGRRARCCSKETEESEWKLLKLHRAFLALADDGSQLKNIETIIQKRLAFEKLKKMPAAASAAVEKK